VNGRNTTFFSAASSALLHVREPLLWANLLLISVMLGGAVYEMIVIDSAWTASLPESLGAIARIDPGRFWRAVGQWMSLGAMGALMANWKTVQRRRWLLISLICMTINFLTATLYFVPLLKSIHSSEVEAMSSIVSRWTAGAWLRLTLMLIAFIATARSIRAS